jgi:putative ABC transport system ATP-binding protein
MGTILIRNIEKTYFMGDIEVRALRGVSLDFERGEFVAIMGASGSGKSTLMNILGCLDRPSEGDYFLEGIPVNDLSSQELADIRNGKIGFVFQGFNLLTKTTALENVELPLLYDRTGRVKNRKQAALSALERVSLSDRVLHQPSQLSGGQQQRVAIARALVNEPAIILADEPTGNLDTATSLEIISLFHDLNRQGITVVLVTHEHDIALHARRLIELRDGLVVGDQRPAERRGDGAGCAVPGEERR